MPSIGHPSAPSVRIAPSRREMGRIAAADIASKLRLRLRNQPAVRIIFAAAPSQVDMLETLIKEPGIDWSRVTAFHMDEYLGLAPDAPQRFGLWLRRMIFDKLPFAAVHLIEPSDNPERSASEYAVHLGESPIDIVCLGIGINGHLAFNDPPAGLNDPQAVKIVHLDAACRQQQVDDNCFSSIDQVPKRAITLTIPRLLKARRLFCCVPGAAKRDAVHRTLHDPISPLCPATALRLHPDCTLYLDPESAPDDLASSQPV